MNVAHRLKRAPLRDFDNRKRLGYRTWASHWMLGRFVPRAFHEESRKNVPQMGRSGFDEFLELKRRDCDFVEVERATQGRPFL
jgi:hypothetical protein